MSLVERLERWTEALENWKPVTGWLMQGFLMLLSLIGMCYGVNMSAYIVGAIVIGVMRAIERERRDNDKR